MKLQKEEKLKKELMEMAATADEDAEGSDELIEMMGVVPSKRRFKSGTMERRDVGRLW